MSPTDIQFTISPDDAGARVDVFLSQRLGMGRTAVRHLLDTGHVELGKHLLNEGSKGLLLRAGSILTVRHFEHPNDVAIIANPNLSLTILAQGEGWVIVDKPQGMPVHPLVSDENETVLNALICRFPQVQGVGEGGVRSGVVHRLDIDTSGTLLFATKQNTWQNLRDLFRRHQTTKIYRAIVAGRLMGSGRETMDLAIAQHRPARVRVIAPSDQPKKKGARTCHLNWRAVEALRDATLLEIQLDTGFLHQIRAMFQAKGHPIVGDQLYGLNTHPPAARQMLHAAELTVGPAHATSPDPQDFQSVLAQLRDPARA